VHGFALELSMARISRSAIITTVVVVVLLASLPGAIRRIVQTGDLYLFSQAFFADVLARLSGPGRLRFILQPSFAILLGIRHGVGDARAHLPPFLWALVFHGSHRSALLRNAYAGIRDLVAVAILLDIVSQILIFHEIHPGAAVIVGPVLIGGPYALARALTNRIVRARRGPTAAAPAA
jgi:hypothetical protein